MAFRIKTGGYRVEWYPKVTSTAIAVGDMLIWSSNLVQSAAAGNSTSNFAGIALRAVVSGDSDYATSPLVPVAVPNFDNEIEADIGTGTATATTVGAGYDLAAAGTLDLNSTTHKNFFVTKFISATKVLGKFIPDPRFKDIV